MFVNKGNQSMLDNINRDMRYEKFHSAFPNKEGDAMRKSEIKKIVRVLIGTKFYKALPAKERYDFIKYVLRKSFHQHNALK